MQWGHEIQISIRFNSTATAFQQFEMGIYDDLTIKQLKDRIHSKTNVTPSQQLLIYNKQTLWHDHRTLKQYGIHNGVYILLKVYTEHKIEKLRHQYIFTKSIDQAYKTIEIEMSTQTNTSQVEYVSHLRSEIDPKTLYQMAFKEEIEWKDLDKWMINKLKTYVNSDNPLENMTPIKSNSLTPTPITTTQSIKQLSLKPIREETENSKLSKSKHVKINLPPDHNHNPNRRMRSRSRSRGKSRSRSRSRDRPHRTEIKFDKKGHMYKQFIYSDCLFFCQDEINLKKYIVIMSLLFLIFGIGSFFVYLECLKLDILSNNYYTSSMCNVYNETYAIWVAYNEYNGHANECYKKYGNELQVDEFWGDIMYPEQNGYDASTNRNIYNDMNFTSTFSNEFNYMSYECFVNNKCENIILSTDGKESLNNPYKWDLRVLNVVLLFMWICGGLCVLTIVYLYCNKKRKKRNYFIKEWNNTPPDWQCIYVIKYYKKECEFEGIKMPNKMFELVYKYYHMEIEPSKSSKSIASSNIIYCDRQNKKRDMSKSKTVSSRDKTATRESSERIV